MRSLARLICALAISVLAINLSPITDLALAAENDHGSDNIILSVPRMMTYQGILKDSAGDPVPDSFFTATFRIFSQESGGAQLWSQAASDTTDGAGLFSMTLSNLNLPFDQSYWLELQIGAQVLTPRQKLNMSGYAARSDTADYALNVQGGSSKWTVGDGVVSTDNFWGIARGGAGNIMLGTSTETMINLGVSCTTGTSIFNWGYSTVGGGLGNKASNMYSTIGGGHSNQALGASAFVGGGALNRASGSYATVAGGINDTASGDYSFVGGGWVNVASGDYASIPGGSENEASGAYSFAAGRKAKARHTGSFVWGGNRPIDFESSDVNQFLIWASGGVGIGVNDPATHLDVGGTIRSRSGGVEFPDGTTQTTAAIGAPIGGVVAWLKSFPNTPTLPAEYVECNGQTLNDPASPYNGQIIPDLNGDARFLRGGTTSGITGGSANHTHNVNVDDWAIVSVMAPTQFVAVNGVYTSDNASNYPPYYRVVWVMRVK